MVQGTLRRGRVLIIDDEQCIIDTLRRVLRGEHDIVTSTSPREALAVTGGATRDTHELFLRSLTLPCLYKPFDIDMVRQVVRGVVGGWSATAMR